MCAHSHSHIPLFLTLHFIIHVSKDPPQLSLMVSPICELPPWVFHLRAWELAMLSVTAVGVLNLASHVGPQSVSLCAARHSLAQLPKFRQTRSTLIYTISTYHSGWVHSINLQFFSADDQWVILPPSLQSPWLFILPDTGKGFWSPQDIVLQRAFAPPSPGRQWDYTVIISNAILYDSLFHVRDLQSCFINSAWMKPHFKHRRA